MTATLCEGNVTGEGPGHLAKAKDVPSPDYVSSAQEGTLRGALRGALLRGTGGGGGEF